MAAVTTLMAAMQQQGTRWSECRGMGRSPVVSSSLETHLVTWY